MEVSVINRKVIPNNVNDDLVNEKIRFKEVLVINSNGEQLGIKMRREALDIAFDQGLDLLCVAPKAQPPVCKVLDYGKYRFEQQKKAKEAKKEQHVTEVSRCVFPRSLTNMILKQNASCTQLASDGMKVKIDMRFRGRMMTRLEVGRKIMDSFIEECSDIASVEKKPLLEGNTMSTVLAPKKK